MPIGLVLGLPPDLVALARSRIVSVRGLARAALDLVPVGKPISASSLGLAAEPERRDTIGAAGVHGPAGPEWSAGSILKRRLGRELVESLVDPLLGGINAGGVDQLSLNGRRPAGCTGSLPASGASPEPSERSPATRPVPRARRRRNTEAVLPRDAGRARAHGRGARRRTCRLGGSTAAPGHGRSQSLRRAGDRYELETPGGTFVADGVVLAAPGYVAARLLVDRRPDCGR